MTNQRHRVKEGKPAGGWFRQQAAAQRQQALQTKKADTRQKAQDFLIAVAKQQARLGRLAIAYADRCWRVHELMGQLRAEWERAEIAEARVKELQAQVEDPTTKTNGHPQETRTKRTPNPRS